MNKKLPLKIEKGVEQHPNQAKVSYNEPLWTAMIMMHGDQRGVFRWPKVSPNQIF